MFKQLYIKYAFLIPILSILFTSGCGNDGNPTLPEEKSRAITSISGVLQNWNNGEGKTISLASGNTNALSIFGSSVIGSDGSFNITLSSPDSSLLFPSAFFVDGSCDKDITIGDPESLYLGGILIISEGSSIIGFVQHGGAYGKTQQDTVGSFDVEYYFFDRNTEISGIKLCANSQERYDYSLKFEKGWNKVYEELTENTPGSIKYRYSSDELEGETYVYVGL